MNLAEQLIQRRLAGDARRCRQYPWKEGSFRQRPRPTRDADPQFAQLPDSFWRCKETEPAGVMKGCDHRSSFNRWKLQIHKLLKSYSQGRASVENIESTK